MVIRADRERLVHKPRRADKTDRVARGASVLAPVATVGTIDVGGIQRHAAPGNNRRRLQLHKVDGGATLPINRGGRQFPGTGTGTGIGNDTSGGVADPMDPGPGPVGSGLSCGERLTITSAPQDTPIWWAPTETTTCNTLCNLEGEYDFYSAGFMDGSSLPPTLTARITIRAIDVRTYEVVQERRGDGTGPAFPSAHISLWQSDECTIVDGERLPRFSGYRTTVLDDGCRIDVGLSQAFSGSFVRLAPGCPGTL